MANEEFARGSGRAKNIADRVLLFDDKYVSILASWFQEFSGQSLFGCP